MTKSEITELLLENKVIIKNNNSFGYHRPSCWVKRLQPILGVWQSFCKNYRSEAEAIYCICNDIEANKCPLCGNLVKFVGGKIGYNLTCENCSANRLPDKINQIKTKIANRSPEEKALIKTKTNDTLLKKYGDTQYGKFGSDAFKQKMVSKYGDPHYNNHAQTVETNLERYGVTCNLSLGSSERSKRIWQERGDEISVKRSKTTLEKYGVKHATQSPEVQHKMQQTKQLKIAEIEKVNDCTLFATLLKTYGQGWLNLSLPKLYIDSHTYISNNYLQQIQSYTEEGSHTNCYTSKPEKELAEFLKSLGINVIENATNIVKNNNYKYYELDIYLPDYRVAVEFDGIYYHSTLFKDKNYHLRKTECCEKQGIHLIHIFEDYWNTKKDIYKSILKSNLHIYDRHIHARNCIVKALSQAEYGIFLNENHLQGSINSAIRYGLYYNNELVQVIGFGKSRFKEGEYELYRLCSKLNTQIVGGFSKLIKHSNITNFISYIDRSVYSGNGYLINGFNVIGFTPPNYFYTKGGIRLNRLMCQKHKLPKLLQNFNPQLSESENMQNNGYLQIYDCGNIKVSYNKENN